MVTPARFARIRRVLERRQTGLTVLMEKVHKPHNFWAIMRTCDAVGVDEAHAVLVGEGEGIRDRTSMGTAKWVRSRFYDTLTEACRELRSSGFKIFAADTRPKAVDYRAFDYTERVALLVGTEKYGVSNEAADLADGFIKIPMTGMGSSLNVSVATAILLYEGRRQRERAGLYRKSQLDEETFRRRLLEWAYPEIADYCLRHRKVYPRLGPEGEILDRIT